MTPPCEWARRHAPVHERLHGRRPLGVCNHGRARACPGGGELRGKLARVLAREDVDGRTVAHERSGHHRSEPAAAARDDDHLAAHVEERPRFQRGHTCEVAERVILAHANVLCVSYVNVLTQDSRRTEEKPKAHAVMSSVPKYNMLSAT